MALSGHKRGDGDNVVTAGQNRPSAEGGEFTSKLLK
jgi:hypothetical protein